MAETTGIEWCNHTWSPWIGCTRISAACDHCYAADYAHRWKVARFEAGAPRKRTSADYWKQPLRWNRQAAAAGRCATVFPSLCDPFDSEVDPAWLGEMLALFEPLTSLQLLLLTKRPQLAAKVFAGRPVPGNVALGITAENQPMLALRAAQILPIKSKVHFLSAEPLLSLIDMLTVETPFGTRDTLHGNIWVPGCGSISSATMRANRFDWVIAGGESGPKARPSRPDWFRQLRDQCAAAEVPFFFKQWGEFAPVSRIEQAAGMRGTDIGDGVQMARYGKAAAGATLDGREHREFPTWQSSP